MYLEAVLVKLPVLLAFFFLNEVQKSVYVLKQLPSSELQKKKKERENGEV